MSAAVSTSAARRSSTPPPSGDRWGRVLRSEWTKFRTVRGWMIGLLSALALCATFTFLVANGSHEGGCFGPPSASGPNSPGSDCYTGHPFVPTGPSGEAVADSYQFVDRPLTGNGTLTARVTSLTGLISTNPRNEAPSLANTRPGLAAWAKAGLMITPSTRQGSPYAAVMTTPGHGIRFQHDYTHDEPGQPGSVSASGPRWLRLTRFGDTVTGYDSLGGGRWTEVGSTRLAALPATVDVGLFVTSPVTYDGAPSQATAILDHVTLNGHPGVSGWGSHPIGNDPRNYYPTLGAGSYQRVGDLFRLTGSGDIAAAVALAGGDTASTCLLLGLSVALIALIVVAAMFITGEYRRGLIRTTFTATPHRRHVLAAKALVIGTITFAIGALGAAVGVPLGNHLLASNGNYVFPASTLTIGRIILGSGALVALTAVAVLALGTILRRSAGAVTAGIIVFIVPYLIGSMSGDGAGTWLFRFTPAAGFSVLGILPRSATVSYPYTFANGYYPVSPLAGLAVLCLYTAGALGVAALLVTRRDA
ncbi:MAG TPA: ABC transporter permease subunit [Solirubrobacteraceae bacterium]|jgi:ABC-type transport system involved in multi-copper enzyme maturation permease subunit|nr:ABC transporter permease subunit [Solirubrobacteraceae bacterium]